MWFQNFFKSLSSISTHRRPNRWRPPIWLPRLEALEDRTVPTFLVPVSYQVDTTGPLAVVTADFNSDTRLDLAVVTYSESNVDDSSVVVLLGEADGTFGPPLTSPTGTFPRSLAVGDFDSDGNLDLATANFYDVSVLRGNGDGTFQAPSNFSLDSSPTSVATGDFNGDGLLDLCVTSNVYTGYYTGYYGYANVLIGDGGGGFSGPNTTPLGWSFHTSAAVADLNADGFADFVAADYYHDDIEVLLGDGTGYLRGPSRFTCGNAPVSVAMGDVNGDTVTDLVTANLLGSDISVLLGDGLGSFSAPGNFATGLNPHDIVLGDFTGDGQIDVVTANSGSYDLSLLRGRGDGTFSSAVNSAAGPWGVAAGDFNGDGWLDAATTNVRGSDVAVLINDHSWPHEDAPSIAISDVTVTEGNTGTHVATFTVTLSAAFGQPVTVAYATADGHATAGIDYQAISGTLTIPAGQTAMTISVLVNGDRLPESNEIFVVNLSNPTNATVAAGQGVGSIVDDEPRINISDVSKTERKKNQTTLFTFTVTLSVPYDQQVTMSYRTVDGTAKTSDQDYVAKTGTLTFAPGETTKTITIEVKGDSKKESNETFYLDLFGNSGNSLFTKHRGIGTILNDD